MAKRQTRHLSENESNRIVQELGCTRAIGDTTYYVYKTNGFNVYIEQAFAHGYPVIHIYYGGKDKNTKLDLEHFKSRLPEFVASKIKNLEIARPHNKFQEDDIPNENHEARLTFGIPGGLGIPKNIPIAKTVLDTITSELVYEGFTHACGDCHSHDYLDTYFQDDGLLTLCSICNERRIGDAQLKSTDEYMKNNEKLVAGTIASIVGVVVCFIALVIFKYALVDYEENDPSEKVVYLYTLGVLMPIFTSFMVAGPYKLFAEAFTIKSIIVSTIVTVVAVVLENMYLVGGESYQYLNITMYGVSGVSLIIAIIVMYKSARQPNVPRKIVL